MADYKDEHKPGRGVRYHSYEGEVYVSLHDLVCASGGLAPFIGRPSEVALPRAERVASYLRLISAVTNKTVQNVAVPEVQEAGSVTEEPARRKVLITDD